MTGFNLPPGVSVSMIPGNRPEDDLAEMVADGWRPQCSNCGGFLRIVADGYKEETTEQGMKYAIEYNECRKCGHHNIEMSYPMYDPDDFEAWVKDEEAQVKGDA